MEMEEVTKHLNILLANRCWDCRYERAGNKVCYEKCVFKQAVNEAIEKLSADTVATIQTGETYGKSAYIKELAEVVRCKDCRHANECHKSVQYTRNELNTVTIGFSPIEWCSRGKRR